MDDFHTIFGGILPMKKTFHKPGILLLPGAFDVILRGMMKMPAQNMDSHFASTVYLFLQLQARQTFCYLGGEF